MPAVLAGATLCIECADGAERGADVAAALTDEVAAALVSLLASSLPAVRMGAAKLLLACSDVEEVALLRGSGEILAAMVAINNTPLTGECSVRAQAVQCCV
eukprot:SAG22_NODE_611_length_8586_cov_8.288795_10_plen_101_part_00